MALEKITDAGDIVKERKRGRGGGRACGREGKRENSGALCTITCGNATAAGTDW